MGEILLDILILAASILLILVVLVQDSKGGGLTSSFGGSNQILGVRKTTDFLEKATWFLAVALILFSLVSAWVEAPPSPTPAQQEQQQQQGAK